jgi:hypothetical protein
VPELIEKVMDGVSLAKAGERLSGSVEFTLSVEGEKYATLRALGYTPAGAIRAIGGTQLRESKLPPEKLANKIRVKAARYEADPLVKGRIAELVRQGRAELEQTASWTRQRAVDTLTEIVDLNLAEARRMRQAIDDEVLDILAQLDDEGLSEHKERELLGELRKLNRRKVLTSIYNQGVTNAVAELNKMHGFLETTVKHDHQVTFCGEEQLTEVIDVRECTNPDTSSNSGGVLSNGDSDDAWEEVM